MNASDDYRDQADTLLLAGRQAAAKMVHHGAYDDLIDLYEGAEAVARNRVELHLHSSGARTAIVAAGILAAHLVHARVSDDDPDTAEFLAPHLQAVWTGDLSRRLGAAREVAHLDHSHTAGLHELAVLLRRGPGDELVAASAHLTRRVLHADPRHLLGEAWYGTFGRYVLVANLAVRAAAVNLVRAGRPKSGVASAAGISRTTLDSWLAAGQS